MLSKITIRALKAALWVTASMLPVLTAQAQSEQVPRTADGHPNLNGIWQSMNTANWNLEAHGPSQGAVESLGAIGAVTPGAGVVEGGSIPYLDSSLAQRKSNFDKRRTEDPEAKCFMPGVPRGNYLPHPFQILQTDTDIMLVYQFAGAVRTINMDKSQHMDAPVDSWMGWSNGTWDGDTLVVDVTGQNANWLDRSGNFATEARRVTERYTLINPYQLAYSATIEDPTVFSKPFTISMPLYKRAESDVRLLEFKCVEFAEELMYGHLRKQP